MASVAAMVTRLTSSEFVAQTDLAGWRILLAGVEASFRADSFRAAAAFVATVGEVADAAGHHPDIDLRYPGLVHVTLTSHEAGGLSALDAELAASISALAATAGLASEPLRATRLEVAIDALDIGAVLPFWRVVLGYVDEPRRVDGDPVKAIVDPNGVGPAFWFQQMDVPRPQRNRIHLDVTVAHDVAEARIAAALAAGGHLVSAGAARAFWILADAEGNEACVCTWQDRD